MPDEPEPLLTVMQAARRLGVTRSALEDWTRAGRVPVVRLSKRITRYDPEALRRWVAQLSSTPPEETPPCST